MALLDEFTDILQQPSGVPSPALVEQLLAEYPFFTLPAAVMLKRGGAMLAHDEADRLRAIVALNSSDPDMLFRLTSALGEEFADFYDEDSAGARRPATEDAIDTFLSRYGGNPAGRQDETSVLERLIFNPVPADYASQLEKTTSPEEAPQQCDDAPAPDDSPEAIGSLLAGIAALDAEPSEEESPVEEQPAAQESPRTTKQGFSPRSDTTFSESLAKIYIRQQKYDKAFEIISNLSLKYPEKSCYFADQMRFLQKLILNNSYN